MTLGAAAEGAPAAAGPVSLAIWTTTPWTLVSNVATAVNPDIAVRARRKSRRALRAGRRSGRGGARREGQGRARHPGPRVARPRLRAAVPLRDARQARLAGGRRRLRDHDRRHGHRPHRAGLRRGRHAHRRRQRSARRQPGRRRRALHGRGHALGARCVKDADPRIIVDLRERGLLLAEVPYEHSYPFCWRCDTPLLYYSKTTWYVKTTAIKDQLHRSQRSRRPGIPSNIKHGRFGEWLENNVDWALSRDRYWGTPLPIWSCEKGHTHCVGSVAELRELAAGERARRSRTASTVTSTTSF